MKLSAMYYIKYYTDTLIILLRYYIFQELKSTYKWLSKSWYCCCSKPRHQQQGDWQQSLVRWHLDLIQARSSSCPQVGVSWAVCECTQSSLLLKRVFVSSPHSYSFLYGAHLQLCGGFCPLSHSLFPLLVSSVSCIISNGTVSHSISDWNMPIQSHQLTR